MENVKDLQKFVWGLGFFSKSVKLSSYIDYGTPFFFVILNISYQEYKRSNQSLMKPGENWKKGQFYGKQ